MLNSITVIHSAIVRQVSSVLYQSTVLVHQRQPDLLLEKYRTAPWGADRHQAEYLDRLTAWLAQATDLVLLRERIKAYVGMVFTPQLSESALFNQLITQVDRVIQEATPKPEISVENSSTQSTPDSTEPASTNGNVLQNEAIAVLLLDAENIQLSTDEENFLVGHSTASVQVKIAFANWRNSRLTKVDVELHERGYLMIHVPAQKNGADIKMTAIGSSLRLHYPSAKEVFVCSSDNDLNHLRNTLQTQGLRVYAVRKQGNKLNISDPTTGKTETYDAKPKVEVPPIAQCIQSLKEIIRTEQKSTGSQWVAVPKVLGDFAQKHKLSMSRVVATHYPGKKAKDIFSIYPQDFVVHQIPEQKNILVALFEAFQPIDSSLPDSKVQPSVNSTQETKPQPIAITSKEQLELALVNSLKEVTQKSPTSYISIGILATQFSKNYGKPIGEVIKSLKLNIKYPKLLQASKHFKVQQVNKDWHVKLS